MKTMLLIAISALSISSAKAADFTAEVKDADGIAYCYRPSADQKQCDKNLTLGLAILHAFDDRANLQNVSPAERDRRGELAETLIHAKDPSLLEADKKMIKDAIGGSFPPSLVHTLWKMLDAP